MDRKSVSIMGRTGFPVFFCVCVLDLAAKSGHGLFCMYNTSTAEEGLRGYEH